MSATDTNAHDLAALPGAAPDPAPASTAYFMFWGMALVFLVIIAIHYVVYSVLDAELQQKARGSDELRQVKAIQMKRLEEPEQGQLSIEEAMRRVAQEHRR